ncbi:2-isopropylmalate synthase [Litorivivens sp.]|uniref:2-isopropylmalate synthase n=1 Tax=Litorivivens sp. TaxID=2020868 RepID=UPI00356863D8
MSFDHRKYRRFEVPNKPDRQWPNNRVDHAPRWCAVDLRDGNQALVKPMSPAQKQRMFDLLIKVGAKEIEIGFPSASQPDFDFCRKLIDENRIPDDVTIQVLTQARPELISRSFEALKGARRAIVHVYNSTSVVQREQVFGLDKEGIRQIAINGAQLVKEEAAKYPETDWVFQYSPESFTGTETEYAIEVIDAVNAVWQPEQGQEVIINLPATVEMSSPNVFADQVERVCEGVKHREHITICLHTHNDRGCAVAAAELGVMAGADRIEGTLMGNGERTGNMDLITMAMNLYSQGVDPKLNFENMAEIREVVESCTDIATHPRHPYVGELVFTAFSGSHQDAIRKCLVKRKDGDVWNVAYLPIDPHDLGRRYEEVVRINSQSGKGGVAHVLERDYNIDLPRWLQQEFSRLVQKEAEDQGGEIDSLTIRRLFEEYYLAVPDGWQLQRYDLHRGDSGISATATLSSGREYRGVSKGVLEAIVQAVTAELGQSIDIDEYNEFAVEGGTNANALACIRAVIDGQNYSAASLGEDTTSAMLQALFSIAGRYSDVITDNRKLA